MGVSMPQPPTWDTPPGKCSRCSGDRAQEAGTEEPEPARGERHAWTEVSVWGGLKD